MATLKTNVRKLLVNTLEEAIEQLKKGESFNEVEDLVSRLFGGIARVARNEKLTLSYLALIFFGGPFHSYISDVFVEKLKKRLLEEKIFGEEILNEGELVAAARMFDDVGVISRILTDNGEIDVEMLQDRLDLELFSPEKQQFIFWKVVYATKQELPNLQKKAAAELTAFYQGAIEELSKGTDALLEFFMSETYKFHMLTSKWIEPK